MLTFDTEKTTTGSCYKCPLREDCDKMMQYTICELLNIPENEVIVKVNKI